MLAKQEIQCFAKRHRCADAIQLCLNKESVPSFPRITESASCAESFSQGSVCKSLQGLTLVLAFHPWHTLHVQMYLQYILCVVVWSSDAHREV